MTGFKVYKGTKQAFIESGKAAANIDSIVFITGGNDAKGSCIYAQGVYFANFAEFLAAINYVKGVNVGGQSYNAVQGGGYIAFGSKDPATVSVNAGENGIEIGLSDAFVNKVNNTATALGTAADAANKEGSAFARIANLAALVSDLTGGSTDSIEGQITAAINALRTEIVGTLDTADAKTLAAINDELDGLDVKVKAIADDYLKAADKQELNDAIAGVSGRVATLEAIDHAKLASDASAAAVATILDGAPEKFDTLKEVAQWIADSETAADAADLVTRVKALEDIDHDAYVAADETVLASAKSYADGLVMDGETPRFDAKGAAAQALVDAKAYVDPKFQAVNTKIGTVPEGKDVVTMISDAKTAAETAANGYTDGKIAEITAAETGILAQAKAYADSQDEVALAAANKYTDDALTALVGKDGQVGKNTAAIATLNGNAETIGSVDYKIAQAVANIEDSIDSIPNSDIESLFD